MIDHDRLFKELLSTFFAEFLQLFYPDIWNDIEPETLFFQDKELFTDVTSGEKYEADIVAQAQVKNSDTSVLIHVEHQARSESGFPRRMFVYFCRLLEKYALDIYPIALLSFDTPKRPDPNGYRVECFGKSVNAFNYEVIQLNRLNWQNFRERDNAVSAALMAKMQMETADRPLVKLECLRMLNRLELDPARTQLISGFIDIYLRLNPEEEAEFQEQLRTILPQEQEDVMEIVTSWMEKGLEQGRREGLQEGRLEGREEGRQEGMRQEAISLILRQLIRRCGSISPELDLAVRQLPILQLEALGEALLDFGSEADLAAWFRENTTR